MCSVVVLSLFFFAFNSYKQYSAAPLCAFFFFIVYSFSTCTFSSSSFFVCMLVFGRDLLVFCTYRHRKAVPAVVPLYCLRFFFIYALFFFLFCSRPLPFFFRTIYIFFLAHFFFILTPVGLCYLGLLVAVSLRLCTFSSHSIRMPVCHTPCSIVSYHTCGRIRSAGVTKDKKQKKITQESNKKNCSDL